MLKRLRSSEYLSNVLTLFTGSVLEHLIPLLILPVLTRLYTPAEFGVLALFISITSILSAIATGRYEMAIMLPEKDLDAVHLFGVGFTICLFLSLLSLALGLFCKGLITHLLNNEVIGHWLFLVPVGVFAAGIFQMLIIWNSRSKRFRQLAFTRVGQSMSTGAVNIGGGLLKTGVGGLIGGNVVGQIVADTALGQSFIRQNQRAFKNVTIKGMLFQAKKYSDFLKINTLHALADILNFSLLNFIISSFFGANILGYYAFTFKNIRGPLRLIATSFNQVFFQKATQIHNEKGNIYPVMKKNMVLTAILGFPVFIILLFFGPWLFRLLFGPGWETAGHFAQILSPMLWLNFITAPFSQLPIILNRQKAFFFISLTSFTLSLGTFLIFLHFFNTFEYSLMAYVTVYSLFLLYIIIWFLNISKKTDTSNY